MGHDIYARRPGVDEQALRAEYRLDEANPTDREDWLERYAAYGEAVNVAYLRRSAFDAYNRLIYEALGAEPYYAGCSGNGDSAYFNLADVERAIDYVKQAAREAVPVRRPNEADLVAKVLDELFAGEKNTETSRGGTIDNVADELGFLEKCRDYLRETGERTVEVYFG